VSHLFKLVLFYEIIYERYGGNNVTESDEQTTENQEKIPVMQQIMDNPFLLLFIGVTIPTVFYIIWGVMEIVTIPIAK
jgi:hypothetical protein